MHEQTPDEGTTGLFAGLSGMGRNLIGLLSNRLELAALEWSEVRATLVKLAMICAIGIIVLWFALAYWSVLIVYLAWESLGWLILLILAGGFTLLGIGLFLYARMLVKQGKLSLPATMNELRKDRDTLM